MEHLDHKYATYFNLILLRVFYWNKNLLLSLALALLLLLKLFFKKSDNIKTKDKNQQNIVMNCVSSKVNIIKN